MDSDGAGRRLRSVGDGERATARRFAAWAPRRSLRMGEASSWPEFEQRMRRQAALPARWPVIRLPAGATRRVVWPLVRTAGAWRRRFRAGWRR